MSIWPYSRTFKVDFSLHVRGGTIKHTFTFEVPDWVERVGVWPVLVYRWVRYGYGFRRIPLTQGKYAIVDPDDYFDLAKYKWQAHRDCTTFHAARSVRGEDGKRRQVAMARCILEVPENMIAEHVNRNGLDNRKANLRPATTAQNMRNRAKFVNRAYVSRYKGVSRNTGSKPWQAEIYVNWRRIFLGCFRTEVAAAKAYDRAAKKYHGEFAALNFPDGAPRCAWGWAIAEDAKRIVLFLQG